MGNSLWWSNKLCSLKSTFHVFGLAKHSKSDPPMHVDWYFSSSSRQFQKLRPCFSNSTGLKRGEYTFSFFSENFIIKINKSIERWSCSEPISAISWCLWENAPLKVHVAKAGTKTIDIVTGSGHLYKRVHNGRKICSQNMLGVFSRTSLCCLWW